MPRLRNHHYWSWTGCSGDTRSMLDHCSISHKGTYLKPCPGPRSSFVGRRCRALVALLHPRSISNHFLRRIAGQLPHPRSTHRGSHRRRKIRKGRLRCQMDVRQRPRAHLCRTSPTCSWSRLDPPPLQVAYQRILQLTYVEDLLTAMKALFIKLFEPFLATFVASLHAINNGKPAPSTARDTCAPWNFTKAIEGWDKVFDKLLKGIEEKAAQVREANAALIQLGLFVRRRNANPDSGLSCTPSRALRTPLRTISALVRSCLPLFSLLIVSGLQCHPSPQMCRRTNNKLQEMCRR